MTARIVYTDLDGTMVGPRGSFGHTAERALTDGVWGCVADGVVWGSMRHVSGRRPPHAEERSTRLKRERTAAVQRAEAVADLVHRLADGAVVLPSQLSTAGLPPDALAAAVEVLRDTRRRWSALEPGATWTLDWLTSRGRAARG